MTRRANGFTLFEVLVAAALMSMVLMGISATFQSVVKVYSDVRAQRTDAEHARLTLALLADDFRSIDPWGGLETTIKKNRVRNLTDEALDEQALVTFASSVALEQRTVEPDFSLARVTYYLRRNAPGASWTLVRTSRAHPAISGDFPEETVALVDNVRSFKLEFESQKGQWTSGWNVAAQYGSVIKYNPVDAMPRAVRITLILRHINNQETSYELYIPLF